jgi:hypothetical protein
MVKFNYVTPGVRVKQQSQMPGTYVLFYLLMAGRYIGYSFIDASTIKSEILQIQRHFVYRDFSAEEVTRHDCKDEVQQSRADRT